MPDIPGYRANDVTLPRASLDERTFAELKASLLFGPDDEAALREAAAVVAPQVEAILDVWYGFVGGNPHLLAYFSDPRTGEPQAGYLQAVRKRFGQWILDTCRADFDGQWLAWQAEIGRRHHRIGKNRTDAAVAAAHIPMRLVLALTVPISMTMRPFLASGGAGAEKVEAMYAAWTKAVTLQAILWCEPYARDGDF